MSPDFKRTPLNSLPQTHGEPLQHALSNFYSREYVKRTLAEIVDGVPARDDYLQFYGKRRDGFDQNKDPSAQAVSLVDDYLATSFCPQSLKVVALVRRPHAGPGEPS